MQFSSRLFCFRTRSFTGLDLLKWIKQLYLFLKFEITETVSCHYKKWRIRILTENKFLCKLFLTKKNRELSLFNIKNGLC